MDVIEVMLGTAGRIGEVLAIRACDAELAATPPTVAITGTVVSPKGSPTYRQNHPKTAASRRTVALPSFAADALRRRLLATTAEDPERLLFASRRGTPLTTNNVRRQFSAALAEAGINGVTPHSFRRTVATVVDRAAGADLAAELLGHTSPDITGAHYIEKDTRVNPVTAEILEQFGSRPLL